MTAEAETAVTAVDHAVTVTSRDDRRGDRRDNRGPRRDAPKPEAPEFDGNENNNDPEMF